MGANDELSPRVMQLYQLYDQLIQPNPSYCNMQSAMPFQPICAAPPPAVWTSLQAGADHFSPRLMDWAVECRDEDFHLLGGRSHRKVKPSAGTSDEKYQVVLQQLLATDMLPDASAIQSNGKSVDEAQLQTASLSTGRNFTAAAAAAAALGKIPVLPSGRSGQDASVQIHQLPTHPQGHLGPQQSQLQSSSSGRAIGANVLFGGNSGLAGKRTGVKRGLKDLED